MIRPFYRLGSSVIKFFAYFGQLFVLFGRTIAIAAKGPFRIRLFARQAIQIGLGSLPIVLVTGAFTGAVFAAQMSFAFSDYGLGTTVGAVVSITICRELGPVLTALMLAGRVGAAMAAQIGTMKVTDQIDALRSMGVHPISYIVVPRFFAMMVAAPILNSVSILLGILASHFIAVVLFGVPSSWYSYQTWVNTGLTDILIGIIKAFFFCGMIVIVACHEGFKTENGNEGVGKATTAAVVIASLLVVVTNLFLTLILNEFFPLQITNY